MPVAAPARYRSFISFLKKQQKISDEATENFRCSNGKMKLRYFAVQQHAFGMFENMCD